MAHHGPSGQARLLQFSARTRFAPVLSLKGISLMWNHRQHMIKKLWCALPHEHAFWVLVHIPGSLRLCTSHTHCLAPSANVDRKRSSRCVLSKHQRLPWHELLRQPGPTSSCDEMFEPQRAQTHTPSHCVVSPTSRILLYFFGRLRFRSTNAHKEASCKAGLSTNWRRSLGWMC